MAIARYIDRLFYNSTDTGGLFNIRGGKLGRLNAVILAIFAKICQNAPCTEVGAKDFILGNLGDVSASAIARCVLFEEFLDVLGVRVAKPACSCFSFGEEEKEN